MPKVEFATLVFRGPRFDEARMPVDVLPELAAYRAIVLSVAKVLFQKENPKRRRVPKGFEAGFQLFLDRIEDGNSVTDVISRSTTEAHLYDINDIFDRARDVVEDGIRAASNGAAMPAALSDGALAHFSIFGKTLLPTERIIVGKPASHDGATYDRQVRGKILRLSKQSYEDNVDLVGEICEADKIKSDFEFITLAGTRIPVNPSPLITDAVRHMFYGNVVRLRGSGLLDSNGKLQRVIDIADLSEVEGDDATTSSGCAISVNDQIESLKALEDGWLDDTTNKYNPQQLAWLARLLSGVVGAFELPTPYVYPAADGLVRAEWSSIDAEIVAKIDVASGSANLLIVHGVDSVAEVPINLKEPGGESEFGRLVSFFLTNDSST
jgi:hypothetical protein